MRGVVDRLDRRRASRRHRIPRNGGRPLFELRRVRRDLRLERARVEGHLDKLGLSKVGGKVPSEVSDGATVTREGGRVRMGGRHGLGSTVLRQRLPTVRRIRCVYLIGKVRGMGHAQMHPDLAARVTLVFDLNAVDPVAWGRVTA